MSDATRRLNSLPGYFKQASIAVPPPEMFLRNSIENILNDKDIKRKEHAQLKKACEQALEELNAEIERYTKQSTGGILPNLQEYILADAYFYPFELACQSKSSKIIANSLDCLQKLIAYGHLIGDSPDPGDPERLLIDRIVEAICYPFQGPQTDDTVQLQIIKAILAVVLSNTAKAHDRSLLLAVRTCFNIYLATRNHVNQSTAKGTLTQIINSVFAALARQEQMDQNIELDLDELVVKSVLDSLINQIVATENASAMKEPVSVHVGGSSSSSASQHSPAHPSNTQSITHLSVENLADHLPATMDDGQKLDFKSPEEKDAFLIFRALCRLSMKTLPDAPDPKSHELRSKLLSLEMILLVLQNFNAPLSEKHTFVFAIRNFLCVALTQNAVSPIISVFEKALAIFVQLMNKFRVHLKRQLEVFFKEIILSIAESPSSSFEHKWIVMHTISKICDNSQNVIDIYINYDCHLTSANIFESLVGYLAKIAGAIHEPAPNTPVNIREREKKMRELGLECLVKILRCLVTFYDEVQYSKNGELSIRGDDLEESSETTLNGSGVAQFEQLKQQKSIIEHGIDLFARKPKQGLAFLQEKGFLGKEPATIAHFFLTEDRLDKTVIGDYLGDGDDFHKQVMYAYVDQLEFAELPFVQALRNFLDKFRLPGEAQKIDRLMEKFASRYLECNPTQTYFASADTAYVLSYAIILLTTDLHSAQVKKKMTKEQFIRTVAGINDQNDLPPDFVTSIYDDIAANEIKMKAGISGKPKLNADVASVSYRQLKQFQNLELLSISQTAHALMEAASLAHVEFQTASHYEHVRPMFKLLWSPCLATFAIGLQSSDDPDIWKKCIEGFRFGIRVACVFRLTTERDAYIQALNRFTLLTAKSALSEMKGKNVDSIKLLINVGVEDGDFLDERWYDVLKCISQLEVAQSISTTQNGHSQNARDAFHIDAKTIQNLQEHIGETNSQDVIVAVDKIFQRSSRLSGEAIVHFVKALCRISKEELEASKPRMFMLQKIVEISFYNMNRIRIEWSMIWSVLGEHFNTAGSSNDAMISHFAMDALRQLSMKFLEKGELPNFRLQKEFLRPFEVIMENNENYESREMTIACITNMVQSHSGRIRSGWKNIFIIFTVAATESRTGIVEAAFTTTSDIVSTIFPKHFAEVIDSFPEAIKCLSEFACNNQFPDICMEAIRLIRTSAELVRRNTDLFNNEPGEIERYTPTTPSTPLSNQSSPLHACDNQKVWAKGWLSIFIQLWSIISRCKLDVRTRSLTVLFEIIKTYGKDFRPSWWTDIFKIVFKIFKFTSLGSEKSEWMVTTCNHALFSIVDVFSTHFTQLAPYVPIFYDQLFLCVQQGSEQLARAAIDVLENLVVSNGDEFSPEMWDKTIELIVRIFEVSIPEFSPETTTPNGVEPIQNGDDVGAEIENGSSPQPPAPAQLPSGADEDSVMSSSITRCIIQLEMVDAVTGILFGKNAFKVEGPATTTTTPKHGTKDFDPNDNSKNWPKQAPNMYDHVSAEHLRTLIEHLVASHKLARTFNSNTTQRAILWKAAFKGKCKPNLIKQETHTIHTALNVLFHMYADDKKLDGENDEQQIRQKLIQTVNAGLDDYISIRSENHRSAWLVVIQMLLNRTFDLDEKKFRALGNDFYLKLTDLIETEEPPIIRTALKRVLARAIQS